MEKSQNWHQNHKIPTKYNLKKKKNKDHLHNAVLCENASVHFFTEGKYPPHAPDCLSKI